MTKVVQGTFPAVLLFRVLDLLPSSLRAGAARVGNRATHEHFLHETVVDVRDPELPNWLLQRAFQAGTQAAQTKLLMCRAALGDLDGVQWLIQHKCPMNATVCTAAASHGQLPVLRYLRSLHPPCPWDSDTTDAAGAAGKHLGTLEWLLTQDPPCPVRTTERRDYNGDSSHVTAAAVAGQAAALQWLRQRGFAIDGNVVARRAAKAGQLEVLQYLAENEFAASYPRFWYLLDQRSWYPKVGRRVETGQHPTQGGAVRWDECVVSAAAGAGHLEVVEWLHSRRLPCGPHVCRTAAANGQLEVLQWLRSQQPPCTWSKQQCWELARRHRHVRKWIEDAA